MESTMTRSGLAIKVAAFSLYLALLDELHESQPLTFPRLTVASPGQCPNLIGESAFEAVEHLPEFDLVVGNPRHGVAQRLADHTRQYSTRRTSVAEEIAPGVPLAGGRSCPERARCLLTPSKWLFNREGPDVEFRQAFFGQNHVDSIINLSALVSGDNRLFNANSPATAVVYRHSTRTGVSIYTVLCTTTTARQYANGTGN